MSEARQRVERLLDPGSFVELDALVRRRWVAAGSDSRASAAGRPVGDGLVSGYGTVGGKLVYLYAQEPRAAGWSEASTRKVCKVMDLALDQGAPVVALFDGHRDAALHSGVPFDLEHAGLGLEGMAGCGEIWQRQVRMSGVVPQLAAVLGGCSAEPSLHTALADFVVTVAGVEPPVLTPPIASPDRQVQVGSPDWQPESLWHLACDNEPACLFALRQLLGYLPSNHLDPAAPGPEGDDEERRDAALDDLVPASPNKPYDVLHAIRAVVDDGRFLQLQPHHARNVVVGFAHLGRTSVGIVANQPAYLAGVLDLEASLKAARFVRTCDAFGVPLLSFVDVPGFMPGVQQELGGIIKHGAKLLYAYAEATVPKLTVILRKSYGGAYAVMGSKHLRTDVNLAWPTAEVAVMGPEGAVGILHRGELAKAGEQAEALRAQEIENYRHRFSNPYSATDRGYIDAVIRPRETRPHLIGALRQLRHKRPPAVRRKHGNLPL